MTSIPHGLHHASPEGARRVSEAVEGMARIWFVALRSQAEARTGTVEEPLVGLVYGLRSHGQVAGLLTQFPCGLMWSCPLN